MDEKEKIKELKNEIRKLKKLSNEQEGTINLITAQKKAIEAQAANVSKTYLHTRQIMKDIATQASATARLNQALADKL